MLRIYISIRRDGRWVRANRRGIAWSSTNICFQSHKYSTWFIRWDFWHCLEWGNALDDRLGHEWKWYFYHTYFCRTKFTIPMVKGKSWVNWRVMIQYLYHPTWFTGPYHDVYDNWHSTILNQTGITRFKGCGPSANVIYFEIPTALFLFILFDPLIAFHVAMCVNGWLLIINELCQMYFRYSAIDKSPWMIVIDRNESHYIRYHIYIYIYLPLNLRP